MARPLAALLGLVLLACTRPLSVAPAPEPTVNAILAALQTHGQPGDWIVRRGLHRTDDAVALLTQDPFSHAALLDAERSQVIEADGRGGVHTTSIQEFARASQRVWILRPRWSNAERGPSAVAEARTWVGRKYDFTGLSGLDHPDRLYCSELCVQAYRPWIPPGTRIPPVIAPGRMHDWATVVWDSGPAD